MEALLPRSVKYCYLRCQRMRNRLYTPSRLSTCYNHFIPIVSGCGIREAHMNWSMVTCKDSTRYWNYLEDYWHCAGGLWAVNAIGTHLRDSINAALIQWRMTV